MASSKKTEDGRVILTTPATWADVGHELYILGTRGEFAYTFPDWLARLVTPRPSNGNAYNVGVDSAEAELALAQRLGLIHASLAAEPAEQAAA